MRETDDAKIRLLDAILVLAVISVADIAQSAPPPAEQVTRSGPYLVKKTFKTEPKSALVEVRTTVAAVRAKGQSAQIR